MRAVLYLLAVPLFAQTPALTLTAITDNVAAAKDSIKIDVLRWSTDQERDKIFQAWTQPGSVSGGPKKALTTDSTGGVGDDAPARGGGRGRSGRGGTPAEGPKVTPEKSLLTAIASSPSVGHLWSSEVAGYSFHYAVKLPEADGGERILLITDRRLGEYSGTWNLTGSESPYGFSVIELRLNAKGEGEGKVSVTGKIGADPKSKAIALADYSALPVILKNVKVRSK